MILLNDFDKKLVIPKWLSYAKAAKIRELTFIRSDKPFELNAFTKRKLAEDYADFSRAPTREKASDLMGAAFVVGKVAIIKEVAEYLVKQQGVKQPAFDLAKRILGNVPELIPNIDLHTKIAENKKFLNDHPNNPLVWIQRARLYTILGQIEKASKCVRTAINLAPFDRYIVRSAIRFFIHSGDLESAWHYVKRASEAHFDPWIKATEISVAELVQKHVKKLKGLVPHNPNSDQIFHFSELLESFGMLELINGNESKAKKSFKLAWLNPSRNVVTHSEWIVRNRFPALAEIAENNFGDSLEATAWQNYHALDISKALQAASEWALEEPFSKRPFMLGSSLASYKKDYALSARLAKEGLRANPGDFTLHNNLCFALLKANKLAEAEVEFAKMAPRETPVDEIVFAATSGLLEFKRGNPLIGRSLYLEAMTKSNDEGDPRLAAKAALNLAIAEMEASVPTAIETTELALKTSEKITLPDVMLARTILQEMRGIAMEQPIPKQIAEAFKHFQNVKLLPPTRRS